MKESIYKTYEELPLFLNAESVAKVLGTAPSSSYELLHEADFPVLKVGSRMVVPKGKFIQWVEDHTQGGTQLCEPSYSSVLVQLQNHRRGDRDERQHGTQTRLRSR